MVEVSTGRSIRYRLTVYREMTCMIPFELILFPFVQNALSGLGVIVFQVEPSGHIAKLVKCFPSVVFFQDILENAFLAR